MGSVNSTGNKLEKALAADLPEDERYFGLENFGNTCYCNSVLQALYFCEPFRKQVLEYFHQHRASHTLQNANGAPSEKSERSTGGVLSAASAGFLGGATTGGGMNGTLKSTVKGVISFGSAGLGSGLGGGSGTSNTSGSANIADGEKCAVPGEETMLTALADLFTQIASQKKRTGSVPPKSFVNKLRQENDMFSSYMHQDAHEFLNFILNEVVECLRKEQAEKLRRKKAMLARQRYEQNDIDINEKNAVMNGILDANHDGKYASNHMVKAKVEDPEMLRTFVHDLFEGQLSNETRCLCCESVTRRVESFFDLSVDVEQNSSLTSCLRSFSSTELLEKQDKFYCDACCSLQEAERRMCVKKLPKILALHLKRFKYVEQLQKYKKLSYRVVFPLELRLCNTSDDAEDPDRLYALFAVVVHVGSGPNQGHYVALIKSHGQWLMFDDDCVEPKDESEIQSVYGVTQDNAQSTEAGYILFYEQKSVNT